MKIMLETNISFVGFSCETLWIIAFHNFIGIVVFCEFMTNVTATVNWTY